MAAPSNNRARPRGALRIIGGAWRGRRLPLTAGPELRPTPDRVRETLFNWLQPRLPGSRCLDVFAGSGALGLEALSRGAAAAVFIERDPRLIAAIEAALAHLGAVGGQVLRAAAPSALAQLDGPFHIVFLDPPFTATSELLLPTLEALSPLLAPDHRVYLEYPRQAAPVLPAAWHTLREKQAGAVGYRLATRSADRDTRLVQP